jgi:hypothetical protein
MTKINSNVEKAITPTPPGVITGTVPERASEITIAGTTYQLVLTTRATREIAKRYGGLQNLGDKLFADSEHYEQGIEEIVWLIALLANQGVMVHNYHNPDHKREFISIEDIEILTSPQDLIQFKDAILTCMSRGTARAFNETTSSKAGKPDPNGSPSRTE